MQTTKDLNQAAEALRNGQLVAIPTETVYGLAANGLDANAVRAIYDVKGRPLQHPVILHVANLEAAEALADPLPDLARKLAETFWPGPLTLVVPKSASVPDEVTGGLSTVGIRMPNHELTLKLLAALDFPLAAPSANRFSELSPTRPEDVPPALGEDADILILDGGPCSVGVESTIVKIIPGEAPELLRLGGLTLEELEAVSGPLKLVNKPSADAVEAPGQHPRHYAPMTRLRLVHDREPIPPAWLQAGKVVLLVWNQPRPDLAADQQRILSEKGSLEEAARNLYHLLHEIDQLDADLIIAERVPDVGLGMTINDRLYRAAHESPMGGE